jgi:glycosyltransferase involved in cell wall biosynthesis
MPETAKISVIIIAKNESLDIPDCIKSVHGLAAEIIVLDSGSTDGTPEICRELGATVVETDWPGDGPQKNRALARCKGDWVLCLDADERVSPELKQEIQKTIDGNAEFGAYRMPRSSFFCGKFMRHSGWWPDYITRFFLRNSGKFTNVLTHTHLEFTGKLGTFRNPIIHLAIPAIEESLDKMNLYSSEGAKTLSLKGKKSSITKATLRGLWMFFKIFILKRGFLDGREGFVLAVLNAEGSFYRHAKLAFMQRP